MGNENVFTGKLSLLFAALAVSLAACASVSTETFDSISVQDRSYTLRTRTIDGPNGSYDTSSVLVRGTYFLCKPNSPGDCEAAVKTGLSSGDNLN